MDNRYGRRRAGVTMSQAMSDMQAKQEQQRKLVNVHRVACGDTAGIDSTELDLIKRAEEKRVRRALKRK